jgi:thiamine biosynthesis protein ThiC
VQAADASVSIANALARQQIEDANEDVRFHELEVERLQELIHQLKGEITALDLARSAAAGFSGGRR